MADLPRFPFKNRRAGRFRFTSHAGTRSFKSVLQRVPLHAPVFLTSFRILVELLIYGAYRNGVFPRRATFEGLNFDIIVGMSALVVGVLLLNKKFSLQSLLLWNVASLLVLVFTVYSFISSYLFWGLCRFRNENGVCSLPLLVAGFGVVAYGRVSACDFDQAGFSWMETAECVEDLDCGYIDANEELYSCWSEA